MWQGIVGWTNADCREVGQDARPTGRVCFDTHVAPLGLCVFWDSPLLSVDIEGHLLSVEVTSDAREQLGLAEGTVCYFIIKTSAVNLLWEG